MCHNLVFKNDNFSAGISLCDMCHFSWQMSLSGLTIPYKKWKRRVNHLPCIDQICERFFNARWSTCLSGSPTWKPNVCVNYIFPILIFVCKIRDPLWSDTVIGLNLH